MWLAASGEEAWGEGAQAKTITAIRAREGGEMKEEGRMLGQCAAAGRATRRRGRARGWRRHRGTVQAGGNRRDKHTSAGQGENAGWT